MASDGKNDYVLDLFKLENSIFQPSLSKPYPIKVLLTASQQVPCRNFN
jgi:hypothetical protein